MTVGCDTGGATPKGIKVFFASFLFTKKKTLTCFTKDGWLRCARHDEWGLERDHGAGHILGAGLGVAY
jgi:hypothetical protein